MPVTKAVMAPGSFEIGLTDDVLPVPFSLTDSLRVNDYAFGHVLVFPTRLDPADYADADLLSMSVFTGIYELQSNRTTLKGLHASAWLGDPGDKGDIYETALFGNTTLATWMGWLKPASLHAGTYGAPGFNLDWSVQYKTPRKAIDYVVDFFHYEWQVTDDLKLNANDLLTLYGDPPTVIASPFWDGRDTQYTAIRATFSVDETAEDYTTRALAIDAAGTLGADNAAATPYNDGLGNPVVWKRMVSTGETIKAGTAIAVADGQLRPYEQIAQNLTCTTDTFCPMADIQCGANMYTFDPANNIYDTGRQVLYAGEMTFPMKRRVESITMQLRDGMGVCFRDGNGVYTDLSDHIAWESGTSRLEVGAPQPVVSEVMKRSGVRA